jgi:uncharacterized protein YcaQ
MRVIFRERDQKIKQENPSLIANRKNAILLIRVDIQPAHQALLRYFDYIVVDRRRHTSLYVWKLSID